MRQVNAWRNDPAFSLVSPGQRTVIDNEEFCLHIADGSADVTACQADAVAKIWRSPADWQVREAFFADLDHDGVQELALLVWRAFEPWPVDRYLPYGGRIDAFRNAEGKSCHLILISLEDGNPEEIWAGSALANPMHSLVPVDVDGDDRLELAAIEYAYESTATSGPVVVWQWNGFGFSLVSREEGAFTSLHALRSESSVILLTPFD